MIEKYNFRKLLRATRLLVGACALSACSGDIPPAACDDSIETVYEVQPGDTLYSIVTNEVGSAYDQGVGNNMENVIEFIADRNDISNPDELQVKVRLFLPRACNK